MKTSETQEKFGDVRLSIELVPSSCWYVNLRKVLPRREWDKIRKSVYAEYEYRCGICGAEGRLECHEIWTYDDEYHVQTLQGFIALCPLCHRVKHIGLTGKLANEGVVDYKEVIQHFMKVNECSQEIFEQHHSQAFMQWAERSKYQWKTDFGPYQSVFENIDQKHLKSSE